MTPNVLIVDDEKTVAWALCQAMREEGYDAVSANSGAEALARSSEVAFHVVLTDLKMPGMTGIEWVRKLREQGSRAKVIVMTAYGTLETAVEALRLGASEYLIKPVSIEAAKRAVAAVLADCTEDLPSVRKADAPARRSIPCRREDDGERTPVVVLDVRPGATPNSFCDLLHLSDTESVFAVGETLSRGPETPLHALAVKSYLRSVALEGRSPAEAVDRLNRLLLGAGPAGGGVSLFYAAYDAEEGRLSYVSAGPAHRLLQEAGGGRTTLLRAANPPLGIFDGMEFHEESLTPQRGDQLILVGGMTPLFGELAREVMALADGATPSDEISDRLAGLAAAPSGPAGVAVVTFDPPPPAIQEEQLALRCDASALGSVRTCAEEFARRASLRYDQKHTVIAAAMEAVINAIRHAYDGEKDGRLSVRFLRSGEQVWVDVWDEGRGFDPVAYHPPATGGYDDLMRTDGRGIFLMRSIMHDVDITSKHNSGTRVRMMLNVGATESFAA